MVIIAGKTERWYGLGSLRNSSIQGQGNYRNTMMYKHRLCKYAAHRLPQVPKPVVKFRRHFESASRIINKTGISLGLTTK